MSHVRHRPRSAAARARELDQTVGRVAGVLLVRARSGWSPLQRRIVRAAGAATTMGAGAFAMALMAPHAAADPSNALQPVINELLDSQQLMASDSSAWPWVTSADLPDVQQYTQTVAQTQLFFDLTGALGKAEGATLTQGFFSWNADAANPEGVLVLPNPDNQYYFSALNPNDTYTVTVDPGHGTEDMLFETISGNGLSTPFAEASSANLDTFTPNADGSYTITLSDTPQSGNWLDTAGSDAMLLRGSMGDWGLPHDFMSIQQDGVTTTNTLPLLSESEISTILTQVAATDAAENLSPTYYGQLEAPQTQLADNTFSPIQPTADFEPGPLLAGTTQISSFGNYDLQPDQALIVKVPDIDASYTGAELSNVFGENAPVATAIGSLNDTQEFQDPDGYTYYVISSQNPGVANWLNDDGVNNGTIWLRFEGVDNPSSSPIPVTTEVVPVSEVSQYLPADTPTVTAAEYAAETQERLFQWDYAQDQNAGISWVDMNLMYQQIEDAVGPTEFNQIFGNQNEFNGASGVPSVLDRMTDPSLMPNVDTLGQDILSDPNGSLIALIDNVPLAIKDVELPTILAAEGVEVDALQTAQAVESDISSSDPSQVLTDLSTGLQGLETVFNDAVTDPTTSITAGILNARDDLATAIMNATSSTSLSEGTPLWAGLESLNETLFGTSADAASIAANTGADASSAGAGLLSDLLGLF